MSFYYYFFKILAMINKVVFLTSFFMLCFGVLGEQTATVGHPEPQTGKPLESKQNMILDFLQNGMMTIYIRKSHLKQ